MFQWFNENSALLGAIGISTIFAYSVFVPLTMGQFQVTQPVFTAIGGYAAGYLSLHLHLPMLVMLLIAVALACVGSLVLVPMLLRLSGLFLGLASFVVVGLVAAIALNLETFGGAIGLYGIPTGVSSKTIWIFLAIVILLVVLIRRSRFGLAMRVIRDDPVAAPGTGLSTFRVNVYVFVVSAAIAAVAGVMQVYRFHHVGPEQFTLSVILSALTYVIVGGLNNAAGPLVGSVLIGYLTNSLDFLRNWQILFNGVFLLIVVVFFPTGLTGIKLPWRSRPWRGWGRTSDVRASRTGERPSEPAVAGQREV